MPQEIAISHPSARAKNVYTYFANGQKIKTVQQWDPTLTANPIIGTGTNNPGLTQSLTTDYIQNKVYENGALKRILTANGYIEQGKYYFYLKDHLGNNRGVWDEQGKVVQKTHYYPFGMPFGDAESNYWAGLQP